MVDSLLESVPKNTMELWPTKHHQMSRCNAEALILDLQSPAGSVPAAFDYLDPNSDPVLRLSIHVNVTPSDPWKSCDCCLSGLDARAAAIVMRTVRNTVDTGRTVVCTIHQPSIDIFEVWSHNLVRYNHCSWGSWCMPDSQAVRCTKYLRHSAAVDVFWVPS